MENTREKVENKIIDWIALGSDGRLVAEKPASGADLVVQKKGDYPSKKILFNIEIFEIPPEKEFFESNVAQDRVLPEKDFYIIFVVFDFIKQHVSEKIWIIPGQDFSNLAEKGNGYLKFDSRKFTKYLSDENHFDFLLIDKLVLKNKPKTKGAWRPRVY